MAADLASLEASDHAGADRSRQWERLDTDGNFHRDDDPDPIAALAGGAYQVFVPGLRGIGIGDGVILPRRA